MTLCKTRTSNYWNHSSEIDTLVNQDDHAAPIRCHVRRRTGFSKTGGLWASVPSFPLPHPLPSNFLLSPQFSRGPNAKDSFACPEFRSLRTGTLAKQANPGFMKFNCVDFIDVSHRQNSPESNPSSNKHRQDSLWAQNVINPQSTFDN